MQTIHLNIDDSIFDKFMGLLSMMPKDKIEIQKDDYPSISFEKAQIKVKNAINNISSTSGKSLHNTIDEILNTK